MKRKTKIYYVVYYLIALNFICFFVLQQDYFLLDSNHPYQWYRIITSMFMHANGAHILSNMFALFFFGILLESIVGSLRFLEIYFISGIAGAIGFLMFSSGKALGASAAIMGIITALTVLRPKMIIYFYSPMPLIVLTSFYVFMDLVGVFHPTDNIGYISHLFGALAGALWGFIYRKEYEPEIHKRIIRVSEEQIDEWEREYMN